MHALMKPLALALSLSLAGAAFAQETPTTEAPPATVEGDAATSENLAMGETVGGVGSTYTQEVSGDWEVRCVRTADGSDPCQLYQLLKDEKANSVAEITMFGLPEGQQAAAGATIITPLETLLTAQVTMQIDTSEPKRYPFTWCSTVGCIARVGFTKEEIAQLRKGAKATITIVPVAAPDEKVNAIVSLKGFSAGYDTVNKINAPKAP